MLIKHLEKAEQSQLTELVNWLLWIEIILGSRADFNTDWG